MSTIVRETVTGFDVVRDGKPVSSHPTIALALDAARPTGHEPHLRDDAGRSVGQFRWLDAATVEPANPAGYFDATAIVELAESLNAGGMPVPIDGGGNGSSVHGTADDSSTPANGWGHAAVIVERADGPHMYMWAELLPDVAQDVDRGRLAYGSIFAMTPARAEDGAYRGSRLIGHALTNVPVIRTLAPSTALRARTRPTRSAMDPKNKQKTETPAVAKAEAPPPPAEVKSDPPPPPAEDKDAMIAALRAELEAAKTQIAALTAEAAARADAAPTEEEIKAAEATKLATARAQAEAHVAKAERAGIVAPSARAEWVDVVMKSGAGTFDALTRGMRARPSRQVVGSEAGKPVDLDPKDPTVRAMRAAGISDSAISRSLIERSKKE